MSERDESVRQFGVLLAELEEATIDLSRVLVGSRKDERARLDKARAALIQAYMNPPMGSCIGMDIR